ncbi:hypothetical protein DERP_011814 [Dermatophagoides pteronyssinus]|uniref:Uncharacterized protein n=1 Tax=Dermatophagoides pteronyssinus TaxID=6956 RepID=A0ABQ8JR51_DERPT|nr:hypothetical protein DERP_011814 [Dermatophagoides pteronyssinus]
MVNLVGWLVDWLDLSHLSFSLSSSPYNQQPAEFEITKKQKSINQLLAESENHKPKFKQEKNAEHEFFCFHVVVESQYEKKD